jgi:phosphoglucomutase
MEIYTTIAFYKEALINVTKKGKEGQEEIQKMMESYRSNPPKSLTGSEVVKLLDYKSLKEIDIKSGKSTPIDQPVSNVLQFITAEGSKVTVRPSGTEPKIKFYVSIKSKLANASDYDSASRAFEQKVNAISAELGI